MVVAALLGIGAGAAAAGALAFMWGQRVALLELDRRLRHDEAFRVGMLERCAGLCHARLEFRE